MTEQDKQQPQKKLNLYTGKCKWFNARRGYGFIEMDDGSEDVFVHQSELYCRGFRTLAEGERVEFNVEETKAINVTGPNGDYCMGAPKPRGRDGYRGGYRRSFRGRGGYRGGYRGRGRGRGYRRGGFRGGYRGRGRPYSGGSRGGYRGRGRGRGRGRSRDRGGYRGGYRGGRGSYQRIDYRD